MLNRGVVTHSIVSHQPRQLLALPTHLLEFLQASHRSPPRKAELLHYLQHDAGLLANLLSACQPVIGLSLSDAEPGALARWFDSVPVDKLRQLAIASCMPWLMGRHDDEALLALRDVLGQSLRTALLAGDLATLLAHTSDDEAHLTGLFHNLGTLTLLSCHTDQYLRAALPPLARPDSRQAEQDLFGTDHLAAARGCMAGWQLDSFLVDAVACQYDNAGTDTDAPELFVLLAAARATCDVDDDDKPLPAALAEAGISEASWRACLSRWRQAVARQGWASQDTELFCAVQREAIQEIRLWLATLAATQSRQLSLLRCDTPTDLLQHYADMIADQHGLESLFFLVSDDQRSLRGQPLPGQPQRLAQLQARIESGTSLLAQALVSDEVLDSFSAESFALGILDKQLLQLVSGQGYCCVPLSSGGEALGVLVLGMHSNDDLRALSAPAFEPLLASLCERLHRLQRDRTQPGDGQDTALLAREIYHEVSSPVSAIRNYLYVLKRDASDTTRDALQQVEAESARISEILLNFRQRALNEMQTNELLDINALIRETASRVVKQQAFKGQLETSLDSQTPRLHSNRTALQQILANLLCNAMEATGDAGHVQIDSRAGWLFNQQRYVSIQVRDDGGGIAEDIQKRLFQPVSSTKGGQHAGLGLSIVSKLIEQVDGLISVHSDATGTCFQILLPETRRHDTSERQR